MHSSIQYDTIINANTSIHNAFIYLTKSYDDYKVWHHRLGHPSESLMKNLAKATTGAPLLHRKHQYFKCPWCQDSKMTTVLKKYATDAHILSTGNIFQTDFGFVRGPDDDTTKKRNIVSSFDGHTSYLLVVDEVSRSGAVLTKGKNPTITIVDNLLKQQDLKKGVWRVRTDQGGGLVKSAEFRKVVQKHKYFVQPTGSDASFQNTLPERPHRTYGNITRKILQGAGLSNTYWSYALLHVIYLNNKLPH